MKIYNEIILQWNEEIQSYETIYEDSFDYDGDLMLMDCPNGTVPNPCGGCGDGSCNCAQQTCSSSCNSNWDFDEDSWNGTGCNLGTYESNYYWGETYDPSTWYVYDGSPAGTVLSGEITDDIYDTACGYYNTSGCNCNPCELCVVNRRWKQKSCGNSNCGGCSSCSGSYQYTFECVPMTPEFNVCAGHGSCISDCFSEPNGDAILDECGVCDGDSSSCADCAGEPNGDSVIDLCGDCYLSDLDSNWNKGCCTYHGNATLDCSGEGDCGCTCDELGGDYGNGYCGPTCNLYIDDCDDCDQSNSDDQGCGCDGPSPQTYYQDIDGDGLGSGTGNMYCSYTSGTSAAGVTHYPVVPNNYLNDNGFVSCGDGIDNGYCLNNSDDYADCTSNDIDFCGICDGDNNCNGCIGGGSCPDESGYTGICMGEFSDTDGFDCNGECSGTAALDGCDVCSGGNSDHTAESDRDCNGDCFGEAVPNDCGVCIDGASLIPGTIQFGPSDNALYTYTVNSGADCANECGSSNSLDDCGWCTGDGTTPSESGGFTCYANVNSLGYTLATTGTGGPNEDGTDTEGQPVIPTFLDGSCGSNWSKDAFNVCHGESIIDACGIPSMGTSGIIPNLCNQLMVNNRCYGNFSGPNMDECGKCNLYCNDGTPLVAGECDLWNSECLDCAGTPNGDAYLDDCNICICGSAGDTVLCSIQQPNCKSDSIVGECGEVGGPQLDCIEICDGEPNHGAILDNCNMCSDNDTSYAPWYTSTGDTIGHVYNSDRDCGGVCKPSTLLCIDDGCDDGCHPGDNSCDIYMGGLGSNGIDDCNECGGNNYDCTYPYLDLNSDTLWFDDGCSCGGCMGNPSSVGYTDNSPGFYDGSSTIDNGSCRYVMSSREFQPDEGGVLVSPDDSNVWVEIVPGTFNSLTTVTLEKIELDPITTPLLPEGDEFNNNMMYRFHTDNSLNDPVRLVMGYDESWSNPKFIRMVNISGESSDGNNYHDKWATLNPASQTTPSFNDCNYNGGEGCIDNHLGYIDVTSQQLYFTVGDISNNIIYGCTDEIAMNYSIGANVQYQPLDCITGDVPTSGCCIYFDTQCPMGMSGITNFPAIYIEGGVTSYVGFTLPPRDNGEPYDLSTVMGLSLYSENPDEYEGDVSEIRITDLEEWNGTTIISRFNIGVGDTIQGNTIYVHSITTWMGGLSSFYSSGGYFIESPTSMWLKFTFEDGE